jgi:hypothetical protein
MEILAVIIVCLVWAFYVGIVVYKTNNEVCGRIDKPRIISWQFFFPFLILWIIPVVIYLAIWGGVFWW